MPEIPIPEQLDAICAVIADMEKTKQRNRTPKFARTLAALHAVIESMETLEAMERGQGACVNPAELTAYNEDGEWIIVLGSPSRA